MTMHFSTISADLEVKDASGRGFIKGYASTFDNVDRGDDVVVKGAFSGLKNPKDVRLLWQHEQRKPIGVWDVLREDSKGLYAEGRINLKSRTGEEAYELLKMGGIRDLSIGYRTLDAEDVKVGSRRVRKLKRLDLVEVSLVSVPMNPEARISDVKSALRAGTEFGDMVTERDFEKALRDAGLSRKIAQLLVAEGLGGVKGHLKAMLREVSKLTCEQADVVLGRGYRTLCKALDGDGDVIDFDDLADWSPAGSGPALEEVKTERKPDAIILCPSLLAALSADLDLM